MVSAMESALFYRYVREVVSSNIVTDAQVQKYYDEHPDEFATPERVKVRHIVIIGNGAGPHPKSKEQALETIKQVAAELHAKLGGVHSADEAAVQRIRGSYFPGAAREYSQGGSAGDRGGPGWGGQGARGPPVGTGGV